jgi:hypothetical protein
MPLLTFRPDFVETPPVDRIETALFFGIRRNPPLESTQLRWQVRLSQGESLKLETGGALEHWGGALFLTTKEPPPEALSDTAPAAIGWMRWIASDGRRSFQIQLAISRVGFDRVYALAANGHYPDAILNFRGDDSVQEDAEVQGTSWKNVESSVAELSEFTLRYDLASKLIARS